MKPETIMKWAGIGLLGMGGVTLAREAAGSSSSTKVAPPMPRTPGTGTGAGPILWTPGPGELLGCDVSYAQGASVNWKRAHAAGVRFAIAKSGQGAKGKPNGFNDPTFQKNKAGMRAELDFWGAYHYAILSQDPVAQADAISAQIGSPDDRMMPPSVDLEWDLNKGATGARTIDFLYAFSARIRENLGRRTMAYTSIGWWNSIGDPVDPIQREIFLWVAHWTTAAKPMLPKGWDRAAVWQFSAELGPLAGVPIDGIPGKSVDRDRFLGDASAMSALILESKV